MPLRILAGLPGSGKSKRLIAEVNAARESGRTVQTFACRDSFILQERPNIVRRGQIGSRARIKTRLDRFESASDTILFLQAAEPGWLLAFDEAQYYGVDVVQAWCDASDRGADVLLASVSEEQMDLLTQRGYESTVLPIACQECRDEEAKTFFALVDENRTISVCDACHDEMKRRVEQQVVKSLEAQAPHPGRNIIYQPVGLSACEDWEVIREDSAARADLIQQACEKVALPTNEASYLDVGCNTGFFCHRMQQIGFHSTGVDVVEDSIELARLLSTYCRRDYSRYVVADAYGYLRTTQDRKFDVTSAFSVFQWVMIQKSAQHGLHCMIWLFRKSRRMCILEMGESTEAHYVERVGMAYDSDWIRTFMETSGEFDEVHLYESGPHNLKRDLFIGLKHPNQPSPSDT